MEILASSLSAQDDKNVGICYSMPLGLGDGFSGVTKTGVTSAGFSECGSTENISRVFEDQAQVRLEVMR